jgi:hypothetical protein
MFIYVPIVDDTFNFCDCQLFFLPAVCFHYNSSKHLFFLIERAAVIDSLRNHRLPLATLLSVFTLFGKYPLYLLCLLHSFC